MAGFLERMVARFVDVVGESEERRELAREETQRQVGNWSRLNQMAEDHAAAGRTSTAFNLWRQAGVAEVKASKAAGEAGGRSWL